MVSGQEGGTLKMSPEKRLTDETAKMLMYRLNMDALSAEPGTLYLGQPVRLTDVYIVEQEPLIIKHDSSAPGPRTTLTASQALIDQLISKGFLPKEDSK